MCFLFPADRSSTGIVEFDKQAHAVEAVIAVNHYPIEVDGRFERTFFFRTCWLLPYSCSFTQFSQ